MRTVSSTIGAVLVSAVTAAFVQGFGAANVCAGTINYGDFAGVSVNYQHVTESSGSDSDPLFGAPTVSGNTLDFNPVGFTANSAGGGPPDLTDGQLNFGIQAHSGSYIDYLMFSELGEFTLAGIGTSDTYASVSGNLFIEITEVNGLSIDPISFNQPMNYSPEASGKFTLTDYGTGSSTVWNGDATINISDMVAGVTKLSVVLDNVLLATSESGSTSFIAKKDFKGFTVTVVPEPSTVALALGGGFLIGMMALRRRRSA